MRVAVDELWTTPSTLHFRILVWGPENAWRHKYWSSIPLEDIPEEVIIALYQQYLDGQPAEDHQQTALF